MKLEVLGCAGGEGIGLRATSFLLNDTMLIDAGSVVSSCDLELQKRIEYALITHPHLDHIKDIGFMVDNTFGQRHTSLKVYSEATVIQSLKDHYFNWVIWPDFSKLPSEDQPVMELLELEQGIHLDGLEIHYYPVNHPGGSFGYLIREISSDTSILITGDTAPTEVIWDAAKNCPTLRAIFVDTAFPDDMVELANASGHYTPGQLYKDLSAHELLDLPIYCYHLKPAYHSQVEQDILAHKDDNFRLLCQDQVLNF